MKLTLFLVAVLCSACATARLDHMPGAGGNAIAFDYDGTCAATPDLCVDFFRLTHERGLTPVILTARSETLGGAVVEFTRRSSAKLGFEVPVIFGGGKKKSEQAKRAGYEPVFICDDRSVSAQLAYDFSQIEGGKRGAKILYVCGSSVPEPSWIEKAQSYLFEGGL